MRPWAGAVAAAAVVGGALVALTWPAPAGGVTLRYDPDGVQMTCTSAQLGQVATVTGDGAPFRAVCDRDGDMYVWDAR